MVLKVSGIYAKRCPYTIVPKWKNVNLFVSQRVEQQPKSSVSSLFRLKYQFTAIDEKKKSERASRNPCVHKVSTIIKAPIMTGLMIFYYDLWLCEYARKIMLMVSAPMDKIEKKNEARMM